MFEALRCIFVPYRPRAIEDRLLGLEPALDDFGSKLTRRRCQRILCSVRPSLRISRRSARQRIRLLHELVKSLLLVLPARPSEQSISFSTSPRKRSLPLANSVVLLDLPFPPLLHVIPLRR
jgi:hypothetical protein